MSAVAMQSKSNAPLKPPATAVPVAALVGRQPAAPPRPVAADADSARAIVMSVIKRIEGYIEEETAALEKSLDFDFRAANDRKSQGLADLNQALRRLPRSDANSDLQKRMVVFREKLAINLRTIRLHLNAVKEIAAILSDAIQNADSDGTYTRNIGPYRNAT